MIKTHLYQACLKLVDQRILNAKEALEDVQTGANEETKSTAGDKHDTSRAMMQIEAEQNAKQLAEAERLKHALKQININKKNSAAELGSLVITNKGNYFLSIGIGKLEIEGQIYFALSAGSPLGELLIGKTEGSSFSFNNQDFEVLKIV
jgi:transcription elongation GreA/GreB family factor